MRDEDNELEHWEICMSQIDKQIINLLEEGYDIKDISRALSWLLHEICCE